MILAFILIGLILVCDVLFFPTLLNCVLIKIFGLPQIVEGSAFLNWGIVGSGNYALQLTAGWHFILVTIIVTVLTSILSKNKNSLNSDAYGSARFMTDEEFDAITPSYIFRSNEQEFIEENNHTEIEINKTSNVNIFENIDFTLPELEEKEVESNE